MTEPVDLVPAAERMARLVKGMPDDAIGWPTPCREYTVGDLLDHVGGAALAFIAAAVKEPLDRASVADAANLGSDWRSRIPRDLLALGEAWRQPDAWTGVTAAGGVELPGDVAGLVALDELVIHGWDLAVATGQPAGYEGPGLEAVYATVQHPERAPPHGSLQGQPGAPDRIRLTRTARATPQLPPKGAVVDA